MTTAVVRMSSRGVSKVQADEWDQLVPVWLHGRPASTRGVYEHEIARFRSWVARPISRITLPDLQRYADTLEGKPRTIARKLATIKSLLGFGQKTGALKVNVGAALRLPTIVDDLVTRILESEQILKMIALEPNPRNRVLLRDLY
jgi:site-specific recombinase XerD